MANTAIAVIMSFFIPGSGLLYINAGKYWKRFLLCFLLSFLVFPWILGMYWSYKYSKESAEKKGQICPSCRARKLVYLTTSKIWACPNCGYRTRVPGKTRK